MSRGGARTGSGRKPDPGSARSQKRELFTVQLPSEGYQGDIPEFPKPAQDQRVLDLWNEAWRTPQAAVWANEPWRWPEIAEYCVVQFHIEAEVSAALIAQVHRYRASLGLTDAAMLEKGWTVSGDEVSEKRSEKESAETEPERPMTARERRLAAVADAQ